MLLSGRVRAYGRTLPSVVELIDAFGFSGVDRVAHFKGPIPESAFFDEMVEAKGRPRAHPQPGAEADREAAAVARQPFILFWHAYGEQAGHLDHTFVDPRFENHDVGPEFSDVVKPIGKYIGEVIAGETWIFSRDDRDDWPC